MKFLLYFATILLVVGDCIAVDPTKNLQEYIFEKLGEHKEAFDGWIPAMIQSPSVLTKFQNPRLDYINCEACRVVIDLLKTLRRLGITKSAIAEGIITLCDTLQIVKKPICRKTITSFADTVVQIIDDKVDVTANDFCGIANYKCGKVNSSLTDWDINIDPTKPPLANLPPLDDTIPVVKIMQLTDVHLDLHYVEGSDGECGQPAGCCHEGVGEGSARAGKFGHFACSMARTALDSLFNHAKTTHTDLKYIFLTGDYVYSSIWENSVKGNSRHIEYVTTHIADVFEDIPIYPVVGNHEGDVCNNFPPEVMWSKGFDLTWLYHLFSEPFMQWIPADQIPTLKRGGYYTVRPDPAVPFRIIVLNTNLCYLLNFWLVYDTVDPVDQLQWFSNTLLQAEKNGEIVYVVGHIPPGSSDCWPVWSDKFDKIINRFEGIIKAQFYGHIHREYFTLAFDDERPISASFPGPSGVPSEGHTAYKIFFADGGRGTESTWEIVNHETWILNLTSSNEKGEADWLKLFNAKEEFGLESIRPDALYNFVIRMITDDDLFHSYLRTYHKGSPDIPPCENLLECKAAFLCELVTSNSGDETPCLRILELIEQQLTKNLENSLGDKTMQQNQLIEHQKKKSFLKLPE